MRPRSWPVFGVMLACALGAGCGGEQKPAQTAAEYQSRAERAYAEALVEFLDQNWEYAAQLMEEVHRNYGTTEYARMAELRLADIAFHQEKYPEAVTAYKAYVHDHPNDPEVPYARYRALRCHFLSSSNNVFQPPLEERDLANVRDAYAALRAFLADFPDYQEQKELEYMVQSVSGMLARHELYVARFYAGRDEFDAAVMRVQYALRTYQGSGLDPEGVVLLGEIYLKMKQTGRARALFQHVLEAYPDSSFCEVARRFLADLPAGAAAAPNAESEPDAKGASPGADAARALPEQAAL